jgi:hypothetical protein
MEGVVKNGCSGRYGIRFIGVTDVQRRRLRQYLADLAASGAAE